MHQIKVLSNFRMRGTLNFDDKDNLGNSNVWSTLLAVEIRGLEVKCRHQPSWKEIDV